MNTNNFWATVCKTVRPAMRPLSCLSVCLSVTLVYCGQTAGWVRMPLGTESGLGPGHIVLDGDPAPPSPTKRAQQPLSIFGTCLLWPNGRPSQQLLNSCYVTLWLAYRVALKLVK